jgi:hypothetical protein
MRSFGLALAVLVAVGGCTSSAAGSGDPGATDASDRPAPQESPMPRSSYDVPARVIDEIVADAAARTGIAADGVAVISAEARTWGDASLGCPKPGMRYTQVPVDGYRVVVSAAGSTLDYRGGPSGWSLCENPTG